MPLMPSNDLALTILRSRSNIVEISPHLHDKFEIYYLISGDVNYFIENKVYELKPGDLIITNPFELHTPIFKSDKLYERVVIQFNHVIPKHYSMLDFDLLQCFNKRAKGENNRIVLNDSQSREILSIFKKIETCQKSEDTLDKTLQYPYLAEILILLNKAFLFPVRHEKNAAISEKILPILHHIADNLDGDLSLDSISRKFSINKTYLSRQFKNNTGINLHEYILLKRITFAKDLLGQGHSVTDACYQSGFTDYSHFIRIFKKIMGMPPGMYKKTHGTDHRVLQNSI